MQSITRTTASGYFSSSNGKIKPGRRHSDHALGRNKIHADREKLLSATLSLYSELCFSTVQGTADASYYVSTQLVMQPRRPR